MLILAAAVPCVATALAAPAPAWMDSKLKPQVLADGTHTEGEYQRGQLQRSTCWNADGTADICSYEEGKPVGQGIVWSADRAKAWELLDGYTRVREISLEEAAQIAARIGLPVP